MNKAIVWICLLLASAFALASDKPKDKDKEKKGAIDEGSFGIYLNGKRIGTEKFTVEKQADEGILTAEISVDDGTNKAEQSSEMRVGADGTLRIYKWRSTLPTREESILEPKDEFLVEHVTTADQKKHDTPYVLPLSTVILDDNFFSQRELLLWRYLQTGCIVQPDGARKCGPSHFGILIPRQQSATSSVVELVGRDKITFKGAEKELNKFKVDMNGVQWFIWMDDPENNYKVLKMAIPSSNIEVLRD